MGIQKFYGLYPESVIAEALINHGRILKFGAVDSYALQAAAATDLVIGVSKIADAAPLPTLQVGIVAPAAAPIARQTKAIGEVLDCIMLGVCEVQYGAAVTRGQRLVSDATGKAIPATTPATDKIVGIAMVSGAADAYGFVFLTL